MRTFQIDVPVLRLWLKIERAATASDYRIMLVFLFSSPLQGGVYRPLVHALVRIQLLSIKFDQVLAGTLTGRRSTLSALLLQMVKLLT